MDKLIFKMCTGCGRSNANPLGLNEKGEPFLACCPDNNYFSFEEYAKHKASMINDAEIDFMIWESLENSKNPEYIDVYVKHKMKQIADSILDKLKK